MWLPYRRNISYHYVSVSPPSAPGVISVTYYCILEITEIFVLGVRISRTERTLYEPFHSTSNI